MLAKLKVSKNQRRLKHTATPFGVSGGESTEKVKGG